MNAPQDPFEAAALAVTLAGERCAADLATAKEPQRRENAQSLFAAMTTLMLLYARSPGRPFPAELAAQIALITGYFSRGIIPNLVEHCRAPGAHSVDPMTAIQIQTAVAYVRAARAGMVSDRAPVKTVALAYGVTRRTVERWAVDEGADALAQCVTRSHGSIEGLCAILPALMATSGAQYRKGGDPKAGGGAHVNRSSKRAPILPARARNRRKS